MKFPAFSSIRPRRAFTLRTIRPAAARSGADPFRLHSGLSIMNRPDVNTGIAERTARTVVLAGLLACGAIPSPVHAGAAAATVDYNRQIRPILSDHCFACHGPDEKVRQAGLRLDSKEALFQDRDGYRIVTPGDADSSRLYQRISAEHEAARMPPPGFDRKLDQNQVDLIRRWISEGAEARDHWAFVKPRRHSLPQVKRISWVRNPVDRFILARLESEGLEPSPEADRVTLIRRVTLDLTGLPPTPAEVDDFLADRSPGAYEKVVERLLASRRYGERMALEWLDASRYADTHGYHIDSHRDMWLWRDWVIDSFNRNQPFDEFTIEQLAGDLLPGATSQQRLATGFNRNHMINFEGGAIPEEYRLEYVVDRVNTTSTVWMGLTMGCARCHDHKYDPIRQREFYRFSAFFNTIPEKGLDGRKGNAAPVMKMPYPDQASRLQELRERLEAIENQMPESRLKSLVREWEAPTSTKLPESPRQGLLAHYELDHHTSDTSGHYRHGKPRGEELVPAEGKVGGALKFSIRSHVDLGDLGGFDRTDSFSLLAWVRLRNEGDQAVVARMDDLEGLRGYDLFVGDFKEHDGPKYSGPLLMAHLVHDWPDNAIKVRTHTPVSLNEWHHLALTYDGSGRASGVALYLDGKLQEVEVLNDTLTGSIRSERPLLLGRRHAKGMFDGRMDEVRIYGRTLSANEVEQLAVYHPIRAILREPEEDRTEQKQDDLLRFYLERDAPDLYRELHREQEELHGNEQKLQAAVPTIMVMKEMEEPRDTMVLDRGDYRNRGERVEPGVPAALSPFPQDAPPNRLGLARWLVEPDHPLTARVTVNRFWQMYYGNGFVKSAENFGSQGDQPSHPELLDWLSTEFVGSGWDVKGLQRLLVTSATYRQSSRVTPELLERDPENRLLARASRFRLPAELVRDNALRASGLLVNTIGGPSVYPYQPPGLWKEMAYGEKYTAQEYVQGEGPDLYRRGLYTFWKRTIPPPTLMAFDAPDRETCTMRRPRTNTPLQALILLNDPTYVEAARSLAQRTLKITASDTEDRIHLAFRLATGRAPDPREAPILDRILQQQRSYYRSDPEAARRLIEVGESPFDRSLDPVELAAWTTVTGSILNLDETITRE